jgi:nucleoside-diphosphate-sugar epimerase
MRVLVVGGTRFIGANVVRRLSEMRHDVTVFHRGQTEAELPPGVQHIHGDRQRLADFGDEFRRLAPAVVLDMCAFTEQDAQTAVAVLQSVTSRAVAISSGDVYYNYGLFAHTQTEPGPPYPHPFTEEGPLRQNLYPYRKMAKGPDDSMHGTPMYNYEKIVVERTYTESRNLPSTILRLPMVYGPGDFQHRLFPYLKRMDDHRSAILQAEGWAQNRYSRGYVENVAAAIALAVTDDRAAGRVYNVAEPEALTETEWVRRIGQATGWNGQIVVDPNNPHSIEPTKAPHLAVDTTRIRTELGYAELTPPDEALRRTVEWERAHPPEQIDPQAFDYAAEDAALAKLQGNRNE